jgi:hypothetical protein
VIATPTDHGVPIRPQSFAKAIRHAELVKSHADSHLVWLGPNWPAIAVRIRIDTQFGHFDATCSGVQTDAENGPAQPDYFACNADRVRELCAQNDR